jgi:hypothetical protein
MVGPKRTIFRILLEGQRLSRAVFSAVGSLANYIVAVNAGVPPIRGFD